MKNILGISLAAMIFMLSGCASVQMAPMDMDSGAKEFQPAPNKASLYIYRNENFGAAIPMTVSVNGKVVGRTAAKTYFWFNVMPGKYRIESLTENVSTLPLEVEEGKNYFVWQEVKMGMWTARSLLQQVDESTGRAGVRESKLIAPLVADGELVPLDDSPKNTSPTSQESSNKSVQQRLQELEQLRENNLITNDEYEKKRQQLLNGL